MTARRRYLYRGLFGRNARRRCPHAGLTPIHGDEINAVGGWRLRCAGCGRLLDGPVSLAYGLNREAIEAKHRRDWADHISHWWAAVGPEPPTVERIIVALRAPHPPFGIATTRPESSR